MNEQHGIGFNDPQYRIYATDMRLCQAVANLPLMLQTCSTIPGRPSSAFNAFHEKAGMSQVCFSLFSLFLPVDSFRSSRAALLAILPSALLVERFSLGARWAFPIQ